MTKKGDNSLKPGVVIVFADRQPAGKLIAAAQRLNQKDEFIWIGSDAWASRESVTETREEFVEGAIAIQPLRRKLLKFNQYFNERIKHPHTPKNFRNPWFDEYLSEYREQDRRMDEYKEYKDGGLSEESEEEPIYQQHLYN